MNQSEIAALLTGPGGPCEVETIDVAGVGVRNWKHVPTSMAAVVEASRAHGERDFIIYGDEHLSFEQHYRRVAALARRLIDDFGVRKGDRVAIAMRNCPEWIVAFWAAAAAGAVVVPMNAWWTSREMQYGLLDCGATALIADRQRLEILQEITEPLPLQHVIGVRCDPCPQGVTALNSLLQDLPAEITLPQVAIGPDDYATLFYTSGTTGTPKGAIGTHRNFCSVVGGLAYNGAATVLQRGGRLEDLRTMQFPPQATLLTVPLFHVSGCLGIMLPMLVSGGRLVCLYKWDPKAALDAIESERVTLFTGVPAMMWQLMQEPDFEERDVSSLLTLAYGGAAAPPELLRVIRKKAPSVLPGTGWGTTETSSTICGITGEDYVRKPDSVGPPSPICEVKVVDPDGKEVATGELGELWVRGANVTMGYWNNPEATAESFVDGWYRTGDIGKVDQEGHFYVLDRLKDIVIRGGENIYCIEVEDILVEHPQVNAACVFGIPDQVLGERVAAVVELKPGGDVSDEELTTFAATRLARFKIPERLWYRREPLPLSATGKVQKKEVKAFYLGQG